MAVTKTENRTGIVKGSDSQNVYLTITTNDGQSYEGNFEARLLKPAGLAEPGTEVDLTYVRDAIEGQITSNATFTRRGLEIPLSATKIPLSRNSTYGFLLSEGHGLFEVQEVNSRGSEISRRFVEYEDWSIAKFTKKNWLRITESQFAEHGLVSTRLVYRSLGDRQPESITRALAHTMEEIEKVITPEDLAKFRAGIHH